jgi:hypothetical protein
MFSPLSHGLAAIKSAGMSDAKMLVAQAYKQKNLVFRCGLDYIKNLFNVICCSTGE